MSWIIEGLLPAGGTSLLAAKPKVGKSTMARCIAFAVARRKRFLHRKTLKGTVLYLAPQEIESEVSAHFEKLGAKGNEPIHCRFALSSEFGISELQTLIEKYKPVLIVLDQLLHFLNVRDESKYAEVTRALQPIEALARRSGTLHIVMTYHAGKSSKPDAGDDPLGSTAFFGAVAGIISHLAREVRRRRMTLRLSLLHVRETTSSSRVIAFLGITPAAALWPVPHPAPAAASSAARMVCWFRATKAFRVFKRCSLKRLLSA